MESDTPHLTSFDEHTFSNRLQVLKALFPYMTPSSRKVVSSYIKMNELNNAFQLCNEQPASLGACSTDQQQSPFDLLNEVKEFLSKKEQDNIDLALNFFSAFQMSRSYADSEGKEHNTPSYFELLKNILTPEQQTMFDNYQTMFQKSTDTN